MSVTASLPQADGEWPRLSSPSSVLCGAGASGAGSKSEVFGQPSQGLKRLLGSQQGLHNGRK